MSRMPRHRVLVPLRWSDMDAYGHVNNVLFARLMEEARIAWFTLPDGRSMVENGVIVAHTEIDYLRPLRYRPAPLAVDVWASATGGSTFDVCYEMLDGDAPADGTGQAYARALTTMVAFDLEAGRPRRLLPWERDRLEAFRDAPVPFRRWREATR